MTMRLGPTAGQGGIEWPEGGAVYRANRGEAVPCG